jgi:hypothetical protein
MRLGENMRCGRVSAHTDSLPRRSFDDGCACNGLTLGKAEMYSNKVSPRQAELFAATRIANNHASMYGAVDLANEDIGSLLQRALP